MIRGAASVTINCPPNTVFDAVTNPMRMGEWSPECVGGRWVPPATGPEVGALFEGDNVFKLGAVSLKKWTTVSEVTACKPGEYFEFIAEGFTTWRYEFIEIDGQTRVTESFRHDDYEGLQKFTYGTLFKRPTAMVTGMEETLERLKKILEVECTASADKRS